MSTLSIVLLVILVVLIIACVVLYFLGKKAEKKQAEQQEQLDAVAQTVSMLIIDKGKMKLKRSGVFHRLSSTILQSISAVLKFRLSRRKSDREL